MPAGATIITGAGSGLGRAIAKELCAGGHRVALLGRRAERLLSVQRECVEAGAVSDDCCVYPVDITDRPAAIRTISDIEQRFDGIAALINNAALVRFGSIETALPSEWDDMLRTNLLAPALLTSLSSSALRRSAGVVVNVGSIGGTLALPGRALYGASKAALAHMTRSLARELAPHVRVNAVIPGAIDTEMYAELGLDEEQVARLRAELVATTPLARMGSVDDVVPWVKMLLGREGRWMTGSLIVVDGGRSC